MNFRRTTFAALALTFLVHDAFAQERRFGAWDVGLLNDKSGSYTATANESNGVFGQFCQSTEASCSWFLITSSECRVGGKYNVFVNSDAGAAVHELSCIKVAGKPHYRFHNFDGINNLVLNSSEIAFAFPVEGSQFKVSRFSLNGASDALALMTQTAQKIIQQNTGRGTRDQRL